MRMLVQIFLPVAKFNAAVKDGTVGEKMRRILEAQKPEAAYFTEFDGRRCGILIVDMKDATEIPALAEPWFLTFDAEVHIHPAMLPEDLAKSGLESLGKKWG